MFQILKNYATDWIVQINDITDFVKEQYQILSTKGECHLSLPLEEVYKVENSEIRVRIRSDPY